MSIQPAAPELTTIEGVDLEADVPCGHSQHDARHPDEPAAYLVRLISPCRCDPTFTYPLCAFGWRWLGEGAVICGNCGGEWLRDEVLHIVEVLR